MSRELVLIEGGGELPAMIEGSGRKARDRVKHFLCLPPSTMKTPDGLTGAPWRHSSPSSRMAAGSGCSISGPLDVRDYLEKARQMAAHASTCTTQLYDRREDRVTLDEVVKINIRG